MEYRHTINKGHDHVSVATDDGTDILQKTCYSIGTLGAASVICDLHEKLLAALKEKNWFEEKATAKETRIIALRERVSVVKSQRDDAKQELVEEITRNKANAIRRRKARTSSRIIEK